MFSSANGGSGAAGAGTTAESAANVPLDSSFGTPLAGQNDTTNGYGNGNGGVCNEPHLLQQDKSNRLLDDKQQQQQQLKRRGSKPVELADGQSSLLRFHPPRSDLILSQPASTANQNASATSTDWLTSSEPPRDLADCEHSDNEAPEKRRLLHNNNTQTNQNNNNNNSKSQFAAPNSKNQNQDASRLNGPQLPAEQELESKQSKSGEANSNNNNNNNSNKKAQKSNNRANLARQESIFDAANYISTSDKEQEAAAAASSGKGAKRSATTSCPCCCSCRCLRCKMFQAIRARRCLLIPLLLLVIYVAAIYSLPFVRIEPQTLEPLPVIPFDYLEGPLKPSSASAFKVQHLFKDQLNGPESLAFDSHGNMYTAIEGGFIMYAHLNKSSPIRRAYLPESMAGATPTSTVPQLIKIAELNGPRQQQQLPGGSGPRRAQRDSSRDFSGQPEGRRECQLDEQVYGSQLYTTSAEQTTTQDPSTPAAPATKSYHFKSNVRVSRCSKPLGVRLSQDESYLYVIDTLNGLYRVNLRQADKPFSSQRQVTRLIDFRANKGHALLPAIQLNVPAAPASGDSQPPQRPQPYLQQQQQQQQPIIQVSRLMNVSLKAIDDLAIDHNAGTRPLASNGAPGSADLIYMTVASQVWPATSFVFDHLEGRPSGLVLRYDTGTGQLAVLEPAQLAHVRNSNANLTIAKYYADHDQDQLQLRDRGWALSQAASEPRYFGVQPGVTLGAPRLDENDAFDDRPLNFPNGLELMDDRQALLIADTSNKRIIKYYIRGPRAGSSDLWAWTPHFPDNIRRGYDKRRETYWVVGCGHGPSASATSASSPTSGALDQADHYKQLLELNKQLSVDAFAMLRTWPRLRKFLLKNIYFFGAVIEFLGANVLRSPQVQDVGYELRTGSSLCSSGCAGMMILQYNEHGDIVRSIHSREFPNDLMYYSQVNELIDAQNAEHALYLGSPSYPYVTKLILPTELRHNQAPIT